MELRPFSKLQHDRIIFVIIFIFNETLVPNSNANGHNEGLTEDAPLTHGRNKRFRLQCYEDGGLKVTIVTFTVLSIAITVALGLEVIYNENVSGDKRHGAVATDSKNCSEIGTTILRKGGNAVDAAVAATICMAVVSPHKTGLGGGGYAMIYSHKDRVKPVVIDFARNTRDGVFGSTNVRLPAVLKGLGLTHSLHGKLPWDQLVLPSSKLAREGFIVSNEFADEVEKNPRIIEIYGRLDPGQHLKLTLLADTLDIIAKRGFNELYNGSLSQKFRSQSVDFSQQMANYKPEIKVADVINFYNHLVYYPPNANSLKHALQMIDALHIPNENASTIESQCLVADVLVNNIYSNAGSEGMEERFSNVVVMDEVDSYVIIITGLSATFGLGKTSDAGFLKDSAANSLEKLTPVLFCDAVSICGLRGITATDDVPLTAELLYNLMVRKLNVSNAVEHPRYYILPDGIAVESDYSHVADPTLCNSLKLNTSRQNADEILKSCNTIVKVKDTMNSHSDSRGGGHASRFQPSRSCINCAV
ncbi:glutathione hydrolase 7 [Neodiprion pinetum]|uniref:Glutathione hydrolase 7 n=1 Tax=Neodiprion lecontei TaxID=441921 RepID=A0ABM3GQT9_NEOLC|nr:glutathione hydrolase 7-like [Neodiprion pinetum]XP_046602616.1 glutathione hydrolase 7 [Neodiprion lecontei]